VITRMIEANKMDTDIERFNTDPPLVN